MLLLVLVVEVAVELAYAQWPIPPGVDPADWIQRSFAWVGLPAVTPDAVGSPYLYPPVMFPILGAIVRLTGSPLETGFIFGGLLLGGYGLSSIHLARRFFADGPTQLLFVGLAVLNGTTLQMLFWGGYPNFLALIFVNEALVFLRGFLSTRSFRDGVVFFVFVDIVYLTHDLTFFVLAGAIAFTGLLLLVEDRRFLSILWNRATLVGLALVGGTVVAYDLALRLAHIETPGYLGSNPAAFVLDDLGRYFGPFAGAPLFLPNGHVVLLPAAAVAGLLTAIGLGCLVGVYLLRHRLAGRHLVATITAALAASVLLVPVAGWAAHVDTDYTRFAYFVPLPAALGLALSAEAVFAYYARRAAEAPKSADAPPAPDARSPGVRSAFPVGPTIVVGIMLVLVFASVSLPTIATNENADAGPSHDTLFLQSLQYLGREPSPGSVLTLQSSVRWVEAISSRGAFDIGPTWLLFEPWQIRNAEETYWAFNSEDAVTNDRSVLAFSGGYLGVDSSPIIGAPLYAVYVEGVSVAVLDLDTADLSVNVTDANGTATYPAGNWSAPTLSVATNGSPDAGLLYRSPLFDLYENGSTPEDGTTEIGFTVLPAPGATVNALYVHLRMPSSAVTLLHAPSSAGVRASGPAILWNVSQAIGPNLTASTVSTAIVATPTPANEVLSGASSPNAVTLTFAGNGNGTLRAGLALSTPGTSNPAIQLPPVMATAAFLSEHQIRYLLLPTKPGYGYTSAYYQSLYGFRPVYPNAEWTVSSA